MMRTYSCLKNQKFEIGGFAIVPIRDEDKFLIMDWRNEQMYHLRQKDILSKENQEIYFGDTVSSLFENSQPKQILFSYLEGDKCIGYGGLVHINWVDKNAEISFLMETNLEEKLFEFHWVNYLKLIEQIAFTELQFHKIFTYAFDLRPRLYKALIMSNYKEEARLKGHAMFNSHYIDVLIHAKINE